MRIEKERQLCEEIGLSRNIQKQKATTRHGACLVQSMFHSVQHMYVLYIDGLIWTECVNKSRGKSSNIHVDWQSTDHKSLQTTCTYRWHVWRDDRYMYFTVLQLLSGQDIIRITGLHTMYNYTTPYGPNDCVENVVNACSFYMSNAERHCC